MSIKLKTITITINLKIPYKSDLTKRMKPHWGCYIPELRYKVAAFTPGACLKAIQKELKRKSKK